MATYNSNIWNGKAQSFASGATIIAGKVAIPTGTAPATGDVLNLFKLRGGQVLVNLYLENNDWGTDVPGTLGHYEANDNDADGTDGEAIDADSILADLVLETTARRLVSNVGSSFAADFAPVTGNIAVRAVVGAVSSGTSAGEKYLRFVATVASCGDTDNKVYTWNGLASGSAASGV